MVDLTDTPLGLVPPLVATTDSPSVAGSAGSQSSAAVDWGFTTRATPSNGWADSTGPNANTTMASIISPGLQSLVDNASLILNPTAGVFDANGSNWTTVGPGDVAEGAPAVMVTIPHASKVILIILYTLTTAAAVFGNSLAIMVFARGKRSNTDLRPFLINLAAADLIMAIFCIPFTFAYQISGHWMFSEVMCPIVQCCQVISVAASVSTNTAIGIDRLVAVKFPFRKRVTSSYTRLVILGIWVFAGSLGVVPLVMGRTREVHGRLQCEEQWSSQQYELAYGFFVMIATYFLPVTILSATYSIIGRHLWRHRVPGNADDQRDAMQFKAKRKVVKMLATIVLLFGVCWLPLHSFIIIITFNPTAFGRIANEVYFGVHWLSMANSFVNPVVYGFMNENFRADLKSLLSTCCGCGRHCGRHGLKYRAAAVKRRLGDGHVHDATSYTLRPIYNAPGTKHGSGNGDWRVNGKTAGNYAKTHRSPDLLKFEGNKERDRREVGWGYGDKQRDGVAKKHGVGSNNVTRHSELAPFAVKENGYNQGREEANRQSSAPITNLTVNGHTRRKDNRGEVPMETVGLLKGEISHDEFLPSYLDAGHKHQFGRGCSPDSGRGTNNGNSLESGGRDSGRKNSNGRNLLTAAGSQQASCSSDSKESTLGGETPYRSASDPEDRKVSPSNVHRRVEGDFHPRKARVCNTKALVENRESQRRLLSDENV